MAKASTTPAAPPIPASYEDALTDLERLVSAMEGGQLPLDTLLSNYQRGTELLAFCRSRLQAVETQVQQLEGDHLKPWGGTA
jgi:exodeoxyribonuclease VII small subunit